MGRAEAPPRRAAALPVAAVLLAGGLLGAAAPALAAVEGSPHDLIAQGYDVQKVSVSQERCNRCHVPTTSAGRGFVPEVPAVLAQRWGEASLACFSCHDGTTIVVPEVDASLTAFHPDAHGGDPEGYGDLATEGLALPQFAGGRLECLTCHEPHDGSERPFLRAPLGQLCLGCHSRQALSSGPGANLAGNHPSGVDPAAADTSRHPIAIGEPFRTPFPSPYPLQLGKTASGVHWDLGGHLGGGGDGTLECATCHVVHGDEREAPLATLLAVDPVNDVANRFCEGCHAGVRADGRKPDARPNPGGTTTARTYHPADDDLSFDDERSLEVVVPPAWPVGGGSPPRLVCTTCHRAHAAFQGSALLREPVGAGGFCESCHQAVQESHHPVGEDAAGDCNELLPLPLGGDRRGRVVCSSCHVAHNAGLGTDAEADYVPLLRESLRESSQCTACHPEGNPTCEKDERRRASHFLGDSTLDETYASPDPPLRTDPWPESKLPSRYGGDAQQAVICLSCHAFREGAVVSGDDGTRRFLLARSGNPVEWEEDPGIYLCTGCHSENPGTGAGAKGHTHPLMAARMAGFELGARPPATATPDGRLNCDSCHRPHEAPSMGGYYILEVLASTNEDPKAIKPTIDFTPMCHCCHEAGKY